MRAPLGQRRGLRRPRAVMIVARCWPRSRCSSRSRRFFPVPAVRDFCGLAPAGVNLWATLLIAALGIATLTVSWRVWPRKEGAGRGHPAGLR